MNHGNSKKTAHFLSPLLIPFKIGQKFKISGFTQNRFPTSPRLPQFIFEFKKAYQIVQNAQNACCYDKTEHGDEIGLNFVSATS